MSSIYLALEEPVFKYQELVRTLLKWVSNLQDKLGAV